MTAFRQNCGSNLQDENANGRASERAFQTGSRREITTALALNDRHDYHVVLAEVYASRSRTHRSQSRRASLDFVRERAWRLVHA